MKNNTAQIFLSHLISDKEISRLLREAWHEADGNRERTIEVLTEKLRDLLMNKGTSSDIAEKEVKSIILRLYERLKDEPLRQFYMRRQARLEEVSVTLSNIINELMDDDFNAYVSDIESKIMWVDDNDDRSRLQQQIITLTAINELRPDLLDIARKIKGLTSQQLIKVQNDIKFLRHLCQNLTGITQQVQAEASLSAACKKSEPDEFLAVPARNIVDELVKAPGELSKCSADDIVKKVVVDIQQWIPNPATLNERFSPQYIGLWIVGFSPLSNVAMSKLIQHGVGDPFVLVTAPTDVNVIAATQRLGNVQVECGSLTSLTLLSALFMPINALGKFDSHYIPSDQDFMHHSPDIDPCQFGAMRDWFLKMTEIDNRISGLVTNHQNGHSQSLPVTM